MQSSGSSPPSGSSGLGRAPRRAPAAAAAAAAQGSRGAHPTHPAQSTAPQKGAAGPVQCCRRAAQAVHRAGQHTRSPQRDACMVHGALAGGASSHSQHGRTCSMPRTTPCAPQLAACSTSRRMTCAPGGMAWVRACEAAAPPRGSGTPRSSTHLQLLCAVEEISWAWPNQHMHARLRQRAAHRRD